MLKNISKVVLSSFLLTGAAQAAELYKDDKNTFTVEVKAQAYAVHDNFGFVNGGKGRTTAPVELEGKVQFESDYTRKINEDLSGTAHVRLDTPMFGYMNNSWGPAEASYNDKLGTYIYIQRAYGKLDHKNYGSIIVGRYQGAYSLINDYSDIDIFIGTPAHDTISSVVFGGAPETGVMYSKKLFNNNLELGVALDGGKDQQALIVLPTATTTPDGPKDGINFKKDYKGTISAQYHISHNIKVGAAYNIIGYRVSSNLASVNNNDLGREIGHAAIVGINYTRGGSIAGLTGSVQNYKYNEHSPVLGDKAKNQTTAFGIEAAIAYDISGQGVGFRPQMQFDYKRSYNEMTDKVSGSKVDKNITNVQALELGLSYYVTPNLYYQAAAIFDLRSDKQIEKADKISEVAKKKATPHHFFGVGVVYKF